MRTALPCDRRSLLAVGVAAIAVVSIGAFALIGSAPGSTTAAVSPSPPPSPSSAATSVLTAPPSPSSEPSASPTPIPTPLPTGIADLTGQHVDDALAHRLPIGVMIDDNAIARPQSGFNGASIVIQAPADGGETRYMLIFQEGDSSDVGPVRSGRIYFIHWISEIRGAIAHYGGDNITRAYLVGHDGTDFTDVDALRTASSPFHRIATRKAPHNAYTSTRKLRAVLRGLGGPATMPADIVRRAFVDPSPLRLRGQQQTIRIPYRTGLVTYTFDPSSDLYLRSVSGRRQVDPADGKRVTTTNVVVLFQSFHTDSTIEPGHARPVVGDIGSGKALVFREGHAMVGRWEKTSATTSTRLFDLSGAEIPLVRGRTFIQVVPSGLKVSPSTASRS